VALFGEKMGLYIDNFFRHSSVMEIEEQPDNGQGNSDGCVRRGGRGRGLGYERPQTGCFH
jgi:hypothetical protein